MRIDTIPDQQAALKTPSFPNWLVIRAMRKVCWLVPQVFTKLYSMLISVTYPFASIGSNLSMHYTCYLRNTGLIQIGNSVTLHKDVWLHVQFTPENTVPGTGKLDPSVEPALILDDRCYIGRRSHIDARNHIHLERAVLISASVLIQDYAHEHSNLAVPIRDQGLTKGGRIRIGEGSWIGQGATILCESGELTLGRNCIVGANAVVTRSAPPYSVLAGNPARIVKHFDPAKGTWVLGSTRSVEPEATKPRQALLQPGAKPSEPQGTLNAEPTPHTLSRQ